MIKYLFSDLDGTLYINDDISRRDFKAVWDFVEAGGVFSIATGRTDLEIVNFVNEERFPEARFRVSNNGTFVVDGEEELVNNPFSMKAKMFLKAYFEAHIAELNTIEISTKDWIYFINGSDDWVLSYKGDSYEINPEILSKFPEEDFAVLKLFVEGTDQFVIDFIDAVEQGYQDEVAVFNDINAVNLAPKNDNKGAGIQAVMDKYQIKPEEIAVIGDGANDIDMFKITPNSFSFYHAKPFVQEAATYTVESVADAIGIIMDFNAQEAKK